MLKKKIYISDKTVVVYELSLMASELLLLKCAAGGGTLKQHDISILCSLF